MKDGQPDTFELSVVQFGFACLPETEVLAVEINGIDLRAHVLAALRMLGEEGLEGPHDAGAFLPLDAVVAASRHWLGAPQRGLVQLGRAAVLTCTCSDFECGGTSARIEVGDSSVTWSELTDSRAGPLPPGPFRFDRGQYERELDGLRALEERLLDWDGTRRHPRVAGPVDSRGPVGERP